MTSMKRYSGEHLGSAHVVALGLQGQTYRHVLVARARFPDSTTGFIEVKLLLTSNCICAINWRCSWDDSRPSSGCLQQAF